MGCSAHAYDSNLEAENDARKAILEASYQQSGLEKNINAYVQKHIPQEYEAVIVKTTALARIFLTKKVEMKWNF